MDQANTTTTNNITVALHRVAIYLEMTDAAPLGKLATFLSHIYHACHSILKNALHCLA